ncbi:uncharacterized protein TNCV_3730451 [Trichonephila clavipes]|uniref:Tc1-like transposase DDE domain-containing protein n=1 Tax=Trichonephila clavipes TaxID=2585209 RepID=A0A8X6RDT0_TRICX|nr:uncharacterized protein TNCV_3730451 [Trichonephila clavipes]
MLDWRQIWGSDRSRKRSNIAGSFLVRGTTPKGGVDGWASRTAHETGYVIPNVLQPGALVWVEKTQRPLVKVLPVPGWRPMKQLAVRMHFIRFGSLLDDWLRKRFQDDGTVSRRYSTCRLRVTKPNEDRYLALTAKKSRRNTAFDLSRQLSPTMGITRMEWPEYSPDLNPIEQGWADFSRVRATSNFFKMLRSTQ